MALNGLDISEDEFMSLNSKQRDLAMFRNVVSIRKSFRDYAFHRKIQYVWLSLLSTALLGFIGIKTFIGG